MQRVIEELMNLEWNKKNIIQKRRVLDNIITKEYLNKNGAFAERTAKKFSEIVLNKKSKSADFIDNFYLKGGRAIDILIDGNASGDYDFQLVPSEVIYSDWNNKFRIVDDFIINTLCDVASAWEGNDDDNIWKVTKAKLADTKPIVAGEAQIAVTVGKANKGLLKIGNSYTYKNYNEVLSDKNFKKETGRIELPDSKNRNNPEFTLDEGKNTKGLFIYVNYTIPGFILYRLVKSYPCKIEGESETVNLKSEIIDVSVPRPGSPECYMSQSGVVTHFREKEGFNIPGWGYHFYENINLLQEVMSGNSGSPHKAKKRWDRLKASIEILLAEYKKVSGRVNANVSDLAGEEIYEPCEGKNKKILGYAGVLLYPLLLICKKEKNKVYSDLLEEYKTRMETVIKQNKSDKAEAFVGFGLSNIIDTRVPTVKKVSEEVDRLVQTLNTMGKNNVDSVIPDFSKLNGTEPYNGKFVFIKVKNEAVLEQILDNKRDFSDKIVETDKHLCIPLRNTGGSVVYAIIYYNNISIKDILSKMILFSQRLSMEKLIK